MPELPDAEPDTERVPSLCLAVHPLAGVTCTELRGHKGPHSTVSGVKLVWHDPDDPRSRS